MLIFFLTYKLACANKKIMKLSAYLKNNGLSPAEFARQAKLTKPTLSRFLKGHRGLAPFTMAKIVKATCGQITYEDLVTEMQERKGNQINNRITE